MGLDSNCVWLLEKFDSLTNKRTVDYSHSQTKRRSTSASCGHIDDVDRSV